MKYAFIFRSCFILVITIDALFVYMPVFYAFTFVHCTAFHSPATEALINNNNNNNNKGLFTLSKFETKPRFLE